MTHGGKRANSGKKKGSINLNLSHYTTESDIKEFVAHIKKNYKKSDKLAVWYGDHLFGKAFQPIGNADGSPLVLSFDAAFKSK